MQLDFGSLIWLIFLLMAFLPVLKQRRILATRLAFLRRIELERKSRVITLIHRRIAQFPGYSIKALIDMEDSEKVLRAIRMTPDDMPIDIILLYPGQPWQPNRSPGL